MGIICSKEDEDPDYTYNRANFVSYKSRTLFKLEYNITKKLGIGNGCEIYQVEQKMTKFQRGCKVIDKELLNTSNDTAVLDRIYNSIMIMKKIDHPNILKIYDVIEEQQKMYLITELLNPKDLKKVIEELEQGKYNNTKWNKQDIIKLLLRQMLKALAYIHNKGIVHRDIKPDNILFQNTEESVIQFKLIDFGLATITTRNMDNDKEKDNNKDMIKGMIKEEIGHLSGTLYYLSPELINKQLVSTKQDIWALGISIYQLVTGSFPFGSFQNKNDVLNCISQIKNIDLTNQSLDILGNDGKQLLKLMLEIDPQNRPEAKLLLEHQYLNESNDQIQTEKYLVNMMAQKLNNDIQLVSQKTLKVNKSIKLAIMSYIVDRIMQETAEIQEIKQIFLQLDEKNEGFVEINKLFDMIITSTHIENKDKLKKQIKVMIRNEDKVNFTQFLTIFLDKKKILTDINISNAFKSLDRDKSETLTYEEIQLLVGNKEAKKLFKPKEEITLKMFKDLCL